MIKDGLSSCQAEKELEYLRVENVALRAQLDAEKRRADAAVEDMKVMALAMRESDELSEGCCFACAHDGQNLPDDAILIYGECPGYEADDCFEWRGAKEEME